MKKQKSFTITAMKVTRKVGKIMSILLSVFAVGLILLVVILLIQSPGKMKPYLDETGKVIEGSMSDKVYTTINGVRMGMIIKSKDISNPVLLFVHGGPGMPEYPIAYKYPSELENYFTVVWWDQRGSGLSYSSKIKAETMTTEQFISDTIEVTKYLCKRFGQNKIYLMGHSWGSCLAIKTAAEAPQLYHAYIGMGQITNQMKSEKVAYDYMLNYYKEKGENNTVKQLEQTPFESMDHLPDKYIKIRDGVMHRAGIGTTHKMKSVVTGIFLTVMMNKEYTLMEKINIWRGKALSNSSVLGIELYSADLANSLTKLNIPVYFLSGKYDYTVNNTMAKAYLKKLKAPVKGFYLFEHSAHSPIFEENSKVTQILREDVLHGRNNLADAY